MLALSQTLLGKLIAHPDPWLASRSLHGRKGWEEEEKGRERWKKRKRGEEGRKRGIAQKPLTSGAGVLICFTVLRPYRLQHCILYTLVSVVDFACKLVV